MRIATFNLENLGNRQDGHEAFEQRLRILRSQIERLDADILCLQEVNAEQLVRGGPREMVALNALLKDTAYEDFHRAATSHPKTGRPADHHNLVIASRWQMDTSAQYYHDFVLPPIHAFATAIPGQAGALAHMWDRPFLYVRIAHSGDRPLHVINLHLKAPLAAHIPGQKLDHFSWRTAEGWAEGFYLAAQKRAGQALEVRLLVDRLFDADPDARILVAGDVNAEEREVPARIICAELEDTANGRLAERVMVPLEHSLPDSRRYTVIHRGRKIMLDHMFASRRLMSDYLEIEIHNEALGDELTAFASVAGSPESYHAPIVASFRT